MADKNKSSPLQSSGAGLLRFYEDETKGVKESPKIVIVVPISLIVVSWAMDLLFIP